MPVRKESATGRYSVLAFQIKALKLFIMLDAKCYCCRSYLFKALIARNIRLLVSCDEMVQIHRHLSVIIFEFASVLGRRLTLRAVESLAAVACGLKRLASVANYSDESCFGTARANFCSTKQKILTHSNFG